MRDAAAGGVTGALVRDDHDIEGPRPVHALDPAQLDVAGRARPADPGQRARRVQRRNRVRHRGDDLPGAHHGHAGVGASDGRFHEIAGLRQDLSPAQQLSALGSSGGDCRGVARYGTLLGEAKINIARLELGRERIGGMAISLIHVDDVIPDAVLARLRTLPNIVSAQLIRL